MNLRPLNLTLAALLGSTFVFALQDDTPPGEECEAQCAAQCETQSAAQCPTATRVADLLTRWETAATTVSSWSPERREAACQRVSELSQTCPLGCRMGDTLAVVRDTLGFVVASQATWDGSTSLDGAPVDDAARGDGETLRATRARVLAQLHELATFGAGGSNRDGEACPEAAARAECPIRIASRIGALKSSYGRAGDEVQALAVADLERIRTEFAAVAADVPALALMPETAMALAEGVEALQRIHAEMSAWAAANPAFMATVPASTKRSFMMESALAAEAGELLGSMKATYAAVQARMPKAAPASRVTGPSK